jgi:hypothetical protein
MEIQSARRLTLLQVAHQKLEAEIRFGASVVAQRRDLETKADLIAKKAALEREIARQQQRSANFTNAIQGAATVAAAVIALV